MANYTWGTSPVISFSISDSIYRNSSSSTYYSGNLTVTLQGLSGGSYFGYSIYCTVNGTQRTLKGNSPSQWSNGAYSESFSISGSTTSSSITITVTLSSNSGRSDGVVNYTTSIGSYSPTPVTPDAPTLSASSVDMGGTVTISFPNTLSSYTHSISYDFGSLTNQTSGLSASSGVRSSATFTPPISLASQIPNSTSGKCTITTRTYRYGSLIGTNTVYLTLNVPSSVVPTITNVAISEGTEGIYAKFNGYVQNRSTLSVAITAAGANGSTVASYETYIQSVPYRDDSFTSNVITASGTVGVVTTVTDSRGRTATVSNSVTVLSYSPPTISEFSAWRITTAGVTSDEGTRIAMAMKFAISSVGGLNDHTYNFKYRKSTDTEFTSFGSGSASWSYDDTQYFTNAPVLSVDYAYVFRLEITDYFETAVFDVQVSTSFTIMDFRSTGKGMAIGKVSEKDALEVAMNAEFTGQMKVFAPSTGQADAGFLRMYRADGSLSAFLATSDDGDGLNLHFYKDGSWSGVVKFDPEETIVLKNPYPVGSIYLSVNDTNPSTLFGGTWEQIQNRFLLAAGSTYSAGDTGGAASHTLTVSEMPSHSHTVTIGENGEHSHDYGQGSPYRAADGSYWNTAGSSASTYSDTTSEDGSHSHSATASNTGGGTAFSIMPPYLAVYMWKRTA